MLELVGGARTLARAGNSIESLDNHRAKVWYAISSQQTSRVYNLFGTFCASLRIVLGVRTGPYNISRARAFFFLSLESTTALIAHRKSHSHSNVSRQEGNRVILMSAVRDVFNLR